MTHACHSGPKTADNSRVSGDCEQPGLPKVLLQRLGATSHCIRRTPEALHIALGEPPKTTGHFRCEQAHRKYAQKHKMQQNASKVILFFLLRLPVFLPKTRRDLKKKKDAVNISIIWKNKINKKNSNDPTLDKTSNM